MNTLVLVTGSNPFYSKLNIYKVDVLVIIHISVKHICQWLFVIFFFFQKSSGTSTSQGPTPSKHIKFEKNSKSRDPTNTSSPSSKHHHKHHSKGHTKNPQDSSVSKSKPNGFNKGGFHKHSTPHKEARSAQFHKTDSQTASQSKHTYFGDDDNLFPKSQPKSSKGNKDKVHQAHKSKDTESGEKKKFKVKRNRKKKVGVFGKGDEETKETKSAKDNNNSKSVNTQAEPEKKKRNKSHGLNKEPAEAGQNKNNEGKKKKNMKKMKGSSVVVESNKKIEKGKNDNVATVENKPQEGRVGKKKKRRQKKKSATETDVGKTDKIQKLESKVPKQQNKLKRKHTDNQQETNKTGDDSTPHKKRRKRSKKKGDTMASPTKDAKSIGASDANADKPGAETAKSNMQMKRGKKRRRRSSQGKEELNVASDKR